MLARRLPPAFVADLLRRLPPDADAAALQREKRRLAAAHALADVPSNADVLAALEPADRARLLPLLRTKPTRTLSGVAVVTVQSSPAGCPHGTCTFCPGGPRNPAVLDGIPIGPTAQSYTGREPAALRAARHGFDPFGQTAGRLADLHATGHAVDKVDFVIQGGTFPARSRGYQLEFVARCFEALNAFSLPGADPPARTPPAPSGDGGLRGLAPDAGERLRAAQAANERAHARMVGLTVETKPDWCGKEDVDLLLELGTTRVEIGVQSIHDDQLLATKRGHTVADSIEATRRAKDAGLKVCHHVMPGLPGWTPGRDLESLRAVLLDPAWSPDMVKIYPTLVMPGTPLHDAWSRGEYRPVDDAGMVDLLATAKALVPPHVRIQRIDRDIPTTLVGAGVGKSNLRELVHAEMARRGTRCRCVRCRETGRVPPDRGDREAAPPVLVERTYPASGGVEHFLAYEEPARDALLAFVRVREPSPEAWRPEAEGAAFVRELRVVGREVALDAAPQAGEAQHRGLGSRLLALAEDLARARGFRRMVVTSGVGVRPYYARRGYARAGPYMAKPLG